MKIAVVTGGTKGIGKAIVHKFLSEGCKVYTCYSNDSEAADSLKKELKEVEDRLVIDKVDLSSYDKAIEYVDSLISREKEGVDYIVFNAGATQKKSLEEIDYDGWKRTFDINLNIPFFMIQRLYGKIKDNGRIIFISSVMSVYEHSGSLAYGVSKASVNALAKYLVKYFTKQNITVNAILTGFTNTKMISRSIDHEMRIKDKIGLGRFAEPFEIANFVWHVVEDGYINGSLLEIDGGYCFR